MALYIVSFAQFASVWEAASTDDTRWAMIQQIPPSSLGYQLEAMGAQMFARIVRVIFTHGTSERLKLRYIVGLAKSPILRSLPAMLGPTQAELWRHIIHIIGFRPTRAATRPSRHFDDADIIAAVESRIADRMNEGAIHTLYGSIHGHLDRFVAITASV